MSKQSFSNLWSFHHHFCRLRACGKYHLCYWNAVQKIQMNTSNRLCYSCFLLSHFWLFLKYGSLLNIWVYAFLHLRTKFGGSLGAALLLSHWNPDWMPCVDGDAGLYHPVVQGHICGVPISQLSCTAPTWTSGSWASGKRFCVDEWKILQFWWHL